MANPFLSLIIPAFNEAERLPLTLIDVDRHLRNSEYPYEIIVIDDGSSDDTAKIVNKFEPILKKVKLIKNTGNRGKGSAVKIGMLSAKGDWRLVMDADNAISLLEFEKMIPYLRENGHQIVIASRAEKGTVFNPRENIIQKISNSGINYFTRLLFKSKVKDFFMDFHCFSAESAEKIFSEIKMDRWSFAQEALLIGEKMGFSIKEIPVICSPPSKSKFNVNNYLQMLLETVKIRWWLKKSRYQLYDRNQ